MLWTKREVEPAVELTIKRICQKMLPPPLDWEQAALDVLLHVHGRGGKRIKNFSAYAGTAARNHCLNLLRRKRVEEVALDVVRFAEAPSEPIDGTHLSAEVEAALRELLDPREALAVTLYVEGIGVSEIAELTGWKVSAIKRLKARGFEKIRASRDAIMTIFGLAL